MNTPQKTIDLIDSALEEEQESGHRRHLGGSIIGRPCERSLWYVFRWAKKERFDARMLRLFSRGHEEEDRIIRWLRKGGITVWDRDAETGKQYRIEDCGGHFGGSLDGICYGLPDLPNEYVLLEFKTSSAKMFKKLKDGVLIGKPEHYAQMQIYMHKRGLKNALYIAVNKDNDEMHLELVAYNMGQAFANIKKAHGIISSPQPPARPQGYTINNLECSWCNFRGICHGAEEMEKHCRTCKHSYPAEESSWGCSNGRVFGTVCGGYEQIKSDG